MDDFHCSFCGKRRREVRKLISGPRVFICNECVALCREIVAAQPPAPAPVDEPIPTDQFETARQAEAIRRRESMGFIDAATAQAQLSELYGVPFTDLDGLLVPERVLRTIPASVARRHCLMPVALSGKRLTVAMFNPQPGALEAARAASKLEVEATVADVAGLAHCLNRHYPRPSVESGGPACSFCGKRQDEVERIIAGPTVYICNECLGLCDDIIAEFEEEEERGGGGEPS